MVRQHLSRRRLLLCAASVGALPKIALARDYIDLEWEDLLPEDQPSIPNALRGLIQHDGPNLSSQQPASTGVRTDWNGMIVRLPGFIVPVDYDGLHQWTRGREPPRLAHPSRIRRAAGTGP